MTAAVVVALATLAGVSITLYFTHRREEKRLEQERFLKLRDDRLRAYASLVRGAERTEAGKPPIDYDMEAVVAEIELLAEDARIVRAARELADAVSVYRGLRNDGLAAEIAEDPDFPPHVFASFERLQEKRSLLIRLAREELGHRPHPVN
jgi:hypothetical protein